MWIFYTFLVSLIVVNIAATGVLIYISYQFFKAEQKKKGVLFGVVSVIFAFNLFVILTS